MASQTTQKDHKRKISSKGRWSIIRRLELKTMVDKSC